MSFGWDAERRARDDQNTEEARAFFAEIKLGNARRLLDEWGNHRVATGQGREMRQQEKDEWDKDIDDMYDHGKGQNHGFLEAANASAEEDEDPFLTKDCVTQHKMT